MPIKQTAPAKINLCLHVVGQVPEGSARAGYHNLDSLVVFADYGDGLEITPDTTPASGFSLEIDGTFGEALKKDLDAGANNLILRAAEFFAPHCAGAEIKLTKNLPTCAGLGGGSADAAATLRALAKMTGADLPTDKGLSLGADVPVCLAGRASRLQGVGEQISEIKLPILPAVLVCPKASLSSAFIFQNLKNKNNTGLEEITKSLDNFDTVIEFLKQTRNDLQPVAIQHCAEIKEVLTALTDCGASLARLSGSGPSCFGLFTSMAQAEHAAEKLTQANPQWWVKSCYLNKPNLPSAA